jgi:hypothetical protein
MLAASMLAIVAASPTARAADLDYYGAPERQSSPYDDPRYRDLYGDPPTRYTERREYEERTYRAPVPPAYVYRDRDDDTRLYEERRYGSACLPRHEIRRRLHAEGWGDFNNIDIGGDTAQFRARRPNGTPYDLTIDRCSGAIISARPLDRYVPGPYAYEPRRWTRPYY